MDHFQIIRCFSVVLILIIITGQNTGLRKDLKYRICYDTHFSSFCTDLQEDYSSENMTSRRPSSESSIDFDPNLILHIQKVSELDLSMNRISKLKFYGNGVIELQIDLACSSSIRKDRWQDKFLDKKLMKRNFQCKYSPYKLPSELESISKNSNETENIQKLILSHNMLTNLVNTFDNLSNLQILDLSYNRVEYLTNETFKENTKLVSLKLDNNQIKSLQKQTFKYLKNLQQLDLSRNQIKRFNLDIFEYLSNLLILRINNNFNFTDDADSLSLIFTTGQKFEKLEMAGTQLSKIPIILTRSIRELDLSDNNLVSIQCGELDSYPLLRILSLQNNKLSIIEEDSLGRLEYLSELNVRQNNLNQIPLSLPSGLIHLDLGSNRIEIVNKTDFNGLNRLKRLILRNNNIIFLEDGAFHQLLQLESLDLSNNPIKLLTSTIFTGPNNLVNLQLVNLSRLECKEIPNCIKMFPFTELIKLEVLNLESSPLLGKQIIYDQSVLPTLSHLIELNLANANLTELSSELVYHLRRLRKLELHQNPLDCSKNQLWLKKWLLSIEENNLQDETSEQRNETASNLQAQGFTRIRIIQRRGENSLGFSQRYETRQTPRCASPPSLAGKSIFEIPDAVESSTSHLSEETAISKPVVNSIFVHKDSSYDDVFYQNDSPESSYVPTVHFKSNITTPAGRFLKEKDATENQPSQTTPRNTVSSKETDEQESLKTESGDQSKQNKTLEQEKNKTAKYEIKNILNKTHIEISRSIVKGKNVNNTTRMEKESQKNPSSDSQMQEKLLFESARDKSKMQILNNITGPLLTGNETIDFNNQSENTSQDKPLGKQKPNSDRLPEPNDSSTNLEILEKRNQTSSTKEQSLGQENAQEKEKSILKASLFNKDLSTEYTRTTNPTPTDLMTTQRSTVYDLHPVTEVPSEVKTTVLIQGSHSTITTTIFGNLGDNTTVRPEKTPAEGRNPNKAAGSHKNKLTDQRTSKKEKIMSNMKLPLELQKQATKSELVNVTVSVAQTGITSTATPNQNNNTNFTIKSTTLQAENLTGMFVNSLNKYNINVEGINENRDDIEDKPGSHPGMLIFLLVLSVLLFSLSLMLISHWTWCRQLSIVYELGEQQILEESDYEINSLTNFKDHEHW